MKIFGEKKKKILMTQDVGRSLFAPPKKTVSHNRLVGEICTMKVEQGETILITNNNRRKEGRLEKLRNYHKYITWFFNYDEELCIVLFMLYDLTKVWVIFEKTCS